MFIDDSGEDYKELESVEFIHHTITKEKSVDKIFEENDKLW